MKTRAIAEMFRGYENKFNPSEDAKGRKVVVREFAKDVLGLVEAKKIGWNDISFRGLYEALVVEQELEENLDSSAFPTITSQLLSKRLIDAYMSYPQAAMALVTVVPSNLREEKVAGWTAIGQLRPVTERADYLELVPPDEKTVSIKNTKQGGLISITREDIKFDQTGKLMGIASTVGQRAAQYKEKLILEACIDKNSTAYNKGQLYKSDNSNNNYLSGAGSALGTSGWETARQTLMQQVDEQGEPIWVLGDRPILMCAPRLETTAMKLKLNEYGPNGTANLDVNLAKNAFDVIANPYYASLTSTTKWHYGAFNRQFVWSEVWPLETSSRTSPDSEDNFKRDVVLQVKASFFAGIGAIDTLYTIENAGA